MTLKSTTLNNPPRAGHACDMEKFSHVAQEHEEAMNKVVDAARALAEDYRSTIDSIKDPELKRSVAPGSIPHCG